MLMTSIQCCAYNITRLRPVDFYTERRNTRCEDTWEDRGIGSRGLTCCGLTCRGLTCRGHGGGGGAPGASAPCAPEGSHSPVPDSTPCSCHQQGDQAPGSQPVGVPLAVRPGGPGVLVPQGPWPEPSHPWRQTLRARRPVHAGRGGAQGWGSQAGTPTNGS